MIFPRQSSPQRYIRRTAAHTPAHNTTKHTHYSLSLSLSSAQQQSDRQIITQNKTKHIFIIYFFAYITLPNKVKVYKLSKVRYDKTRINLIPTHHHSQLPSYTDTQKWRGRRLQKRADVIYSLCEGKRPLFATKQSLFQL